MTRIPCRQHSVQQHAQCTYYDEVLKRWIDFLRKLDHGSQFNCLDS